jgi:MoxR-like ATPase
MGAKMDFKLFARKGDLTAIYPDAPGSGSKMYIDKTSKSGHYIILSEDGKPSFHVGVGSELPMKDGSTFKVEGAWDAAMVCKALAHFYGWTVESIDKTTIFGSYGNLGGTSTLVISPTPSAGPSTSTPAATPAPVTVDPNDPDGQYIPVLETYYDSDIVIPGLEVHASLLEVIGWSLDHNWPTLLVGPKGCGKTAAIKHACAKRKRHYRRQQLSPGSIEDHLLGQKTLDAMKFDGKDGSVAAAMAAVFVDGPVIDAMKKGHILVLDEINMCRPEILAILRPLLDGEGAIVVPDTGERITAHPDFRVLATMNPPEDPNYVGTSELNDADMSRFTQIVNVNFLPADLEVECIMDKSLNNMEPLARKAVEFANKVRSKYGVSGGVNSTIATRELIHWMQLMKVKDAHTAYGIAIHNGLKAEDREAVMGMFTAIFKGSK